ncbi:hypothetical protein NEHOM01_0185 [Nematocida homosporus]|uniref:uncharacterized protein n=1 Tax=Nematocida homosporus TaxID=1912981 RepID=UPI00221F832C|nr:uncharacterized protein NEHOM01_0185 [Nematocida homosporus]KAI5184510.1 hypothetical protein NEHOM01_0185 [Nematocida homosporus]
MRTEIKKEAQKLAQEAQHVYLAINQHNAHLETLERQTQKVEHKSIKLAQKLLQTMRTIQKDGRNTIIAILVFTIVILLIYLV